MRILIFTVFAFIMTPATHAQEILDAPICAQIVNTTDHSVRGSIATARSTYTDQNDSTRDGTLARHSANFALEAGERWDICSSGPFYEGQRLELTLRTLIPVFECRTALIAPILIKSERDENGNLKTWADCF